MPWTLAYPQTVMSWVLLRKAQGFCHANQAALKVGLSYAHLCLAESCGTLRYVEGVHHAPAGHTWGSCAPLAVLQHNKDNTASQVQISTCVTTLTHSVTAGRSCSRAERHVFQMGHISPSE
jgi:hypothetical protein